MTPRLITFAPREVVIADDRPANRPHSRLNRKEYERQRREGNEAVRKQKHAWYMANKALCLQRSREYRERKRSANR